MITRSAIASARSTRCSESTTAHRACSTAARNASAPAASSCDVGSSSRSSCGSSASADARQTRCSSPPESSTVRRAERCAAPTAPSARCDPRPDQLRSDAEVLEAERDLVLDPRHHDLVLGILEDRGDGAGELGRAVRARVAPAHLDPAGEAAAVEVRHEPRERPQERRLAAAGRPEQRDDLSGVELERDVAHRRCTAGVGERQALDAGATAMPPPRRGRPRRRSRRGRSTSTPVAVPAWHRCARTRAPPSPRPARSPARATRRRAARGAWRSRARRCSSTPRPRTDSANPAASRSRLGTSRVARATASADRRAKPAAETSRSWSTSSV